MKTLYLDCGMGAAGDMLTAALLELLPEPKAFLQELNALGIPGVVTTAVRTEKCGICGTQLSVTVNGAEEESEDVPLAHTHACSHVHEHDHEHDHEHHHDHGECDDPNCSCHDHHHHHHADEVFISWGKETPKVYTQADIDRILTALDSGDYGAILRAKGIVNGTDGAWIEFDYVPEEHEIRAGHPDYTGRLCVIGSNLKEEKLAELFGL